MPADDTAMMSLALFDGMNFIRRRYSTIPADKLARGPAVIANEIALSLRSALAAINPTHAALVMESDGPTWRHQEFEGYKADRSPMPVELKRAMSAIEWAVEELGIRVLRVEGFEADDVIASVASRVSAKGVKTIVVSYDKDLLQLLELENVVIYDHFSKEWRDAAWTEAKIGVSPHQIGDLLSLVGDATDSLPGIPLIGKDTAAKLLREYGSLQEILNRRTEFKGKRGDAIREYGDQAAAMRRLAYLRFDVDTGFTLSTFRRR